MQAKGLQGAYRARVELFFIPNLKQINETLSECACVRAHTNMCVSLSGLLN